MRLMSIPILLLLMLSGCNKESPIVLEDSEEREELISQIDQLKLENEQLKSQLNEKEKELEIENEALRTTMNLSLTVLSAMNNKDYAYIASVSSTDVIVKEEEKKILFNHPNSSHEVSINDEKYLLEKLEFRFYDFEDKEKMTIGFAEHFFEGHSTLYFEFIKQDGEWLFYNFITNA